MCPPVFVHRFMVHNVNAKHDNYTSIYICIVKEAKPPIHVTNTNSWLSSTPTINVLIHQCESMVA